MATAEELLQQALELSKRMPELVEKDDWAAIQALDTERMACLQACFEQEPGFKDKQAAKVVVKEILDINQRVIDSAGDARKELEESLLSLRKGQEGADAYKNCP